MDNHFSFVSDSDSSNSSCTELSALVQLICRSHQHPLGHLSPQARNIYLVVPEPGTDPWDEPLELGDFPDFVLDPPCPNHSNCYCAWDDSQPIIDHSYCSYPLSLATEYRAGHLYKPVTHPSPESLVLSQVQHCHPESLCFGQLQVTFNCDPLCGFPHFRFCHCVHINRCRCEPFLKLEVSRTCILIDPVPIEFRRWVASYLRTSKLKF